MNDVNSWYNERFLSEVYMFFEIRSKYDIKYKQRIETRSFFQVGEVLEVDHWILTPPFSHYKMRFSKHPCCNGTNRVILNDELWVLVAGQLKLSHECYKCYKWTVVKITNFLSRMFVQSNFVTKINLRTFRFEWETLDTK